ncbi:MAG: arginine repressor [Gammaproteobacteria bacterium]
MKSSADEIILQLVMEETISDQGVLLAKLRERGLTLTQPTLSRRLQRLSIRKVQGRYAHFEPLRNTNRLTFTIDLSPPNLIVIRTSPGFAQALGLKIDQFKLEDVAGTLAGDDTVFVAIRRPQALEELRGRIEVLLEQSV